MRIEYNKASFEKAKKQFEAAAKNMPRTIKELITASVIDVATMAKQPGFAPYITGNLRRSITWAVNAQNGQITGFVGTNVVYAQIQEFGGQAGRGGRTTIKGKRYMTRSIKSNESKIKRRFASKKLLKT